MGKDVFDVDKIKSFEVSNEISYLSFYELNFKKFSNFSEYFQDWAVLKSSYTWSKSVTVKTYLATVHIYVLRYYEGETYASIILSDHKRRIWFFTKDTIVKEHKKHDT